MPSRSTLFLAVHLLPVLILLVTCVAGNEIQTIREYVNYDISIRPNSQGDYVQDIEASGTIDTDTHKMKPATEIKPVPTANYQPMPHLSWLTSKPQKTGPRLKRQPNVEEIGEVEGPKEESSAEQPASNPVGASASSKGPEGTVPPPSIKEKGESKPLMMKGSNSTGHNQQGDASYYHPHHHYEHDHHHPYPHDHHHHHHEEPHHMHHDDHHPYPHHHHHHEHPHHHPHHHHPDYEVHHPIVIVKDHHHHHHEPHPEVIVVKEKHVHHFHHKPYYWWHEKKGWHTRWLVACICFWRWWRTSGSMFQCFSGSSGWQ